MAEEKKGTSTATKVIIIVLIVLALLGVAGYLASRYIWKRITNTTVESIVGDVTGGNVNISDDGQSMSIEKDGEKYEYQDTKTWSKDIPSSVPEFKYGNIEGTAHTSNGTESYWTIGLTDLTTSSYDDYKKDLLSSGWTETGSADYGDKMTSMEKENLSLVMTYSPDDNSATLIVTSK